MFNHAIKITTTEEHEYIEQEKNRILFFKEGSSGPYRKITRDNSK
jgi:hypothetical protein